MTYSIDHSNSFCIWAIGEYYSLYDLADFPSFDDSDRLYSCDCEFTEILSSPSYDSICSLYSEIIFIMDYSSFAINTNFYLTIKFEFYVFTIDIAVQPNHLTISTKLAYPFIIY